jgi:hypothetical protein
MQQQPGLFLCLLFLIPVPQPPKENAVSKLIVKTAKPRNPLVAPSLRRKAGRHGPGAQRQQAQAALRREVQRLVQENRA